jgi:aminobenzoyl-glutamate utilization protein B
MRVAAAEMTWQEFVESRVDDAAHVDDVNAIKIGRWAELGYQEIQSSALLQERLRSSGFQIEAGTAGIPTAFVASYGSGQPVIGFLAEFDALPGLSQAVATKRMPLEGQDAGHGCGHNLLGSGAILAAVVTAEWLKMSGHKGTVKVFGAPAEEGGGGKVYMVREGLFDDVTVMMNWHPDSFNASMAIPNLAMITGKFRFKGQSAHASVAPELGRSALDGVEAMNAMVNMMREHVSEKARIHYAITGTNPAPNVVPDRAEVYYVARNPNPKDMLLVWERIKKAAEGAALGTGTSVELEVISGHYGYLPNTELAAVSFAHLQRLSDITYEPRELEFAQEMTGSFPDGSKSAEAVSSAAAAVRPFEPDANSVWPASSDVGDVSWVVPTNWVRTATWVPGTKAHTWQAVAASNSTIGLKGMHLAAKVLALTAVELYQSPRRILDIRSEFEHRRGEDFVYRSFIGDRRPPLDFMRKASGSP